MLTKFDEFTCHQVVSTFDHPESSDRAWTEKLWCNIHDSKGGLVLATGFGIYPNRNVMDGFGCVNVGNRTQYNFRASRELRPAIDEIKVGPLSYDVIEPYKKIRIALGENKYDLGFEIEFLGKFHPSEEEPQYGRSYGRIYVNTCRYAQLGRARGWVKAGGKKFDISEDTFYGQRDHSWGIRMGVGAAEQGVQSLDIDNFLGMMINWLTFQIGDTGFCLYLIEKADGKIQRLTGHVTRPMDGERVMVGITGVEHRYKYYDGSMRMQSGEVTIKCEDGSVYDLSMKEITTMYLRGGNYIGYKDVRHGMWMGRYWEDGEAWNIEDDRIKNEMHGLDDTVVEVRMGKQIGYGIVENLILPPFPKYGY
ncbi:MAG: hypothetical protein MUD12_10660 [Spirochaetes bacterium]|jgi:hypothetical protein|nr:hypothetical protein [Spirochaetota bacterium]